jgi:excisionase family DNA binding protein
MTKSQSPARRRWASLDAAAEYIGVSPKTLRRRIADGEITGYRIGARLIRVDLAELDALASPIPTRGTI